MTPRSTRFSMIERGPFTRRTPRQQWAITPTTLSISTGASVGVPRQRSDRSVRAPAVVRHWDGPIGVALDQLTIRTVADLAYAYGFLHLTGRRTDGSDTDVWARITVCLERRMTKWMIVHEHQSHEDGRQRLVRVRLTAHANLNRGLEQRTARREVLLGDRRLESRSRNRHQSADRSRALPGCVCKIAWAMTWARLCRIVESASSEMLDSH
jgi:hypothetical protein